MLIVGRKTNQKIVIADNIEITILEIGRNRVRFGIEAPKEVRVHTKQKEPAPSGSPALETTPRQSKRARAVAAQRSGHAR